MAAPYQIVRRLDDNKLVDLHVNIPTLAVIIMQTFAASWALSSLFSENSAQTKQLTEMVTRIQQVEGAIAGAKVIESRILTLETELRLVRVHMDQLNNKRR